MTISIGIEGFFYKESGLNTDNHTMYLSLILLTLFSLNSAFSNDVECADVSSDFASLIDNKKSVTIPKAPEIPKMKEIEKVVIPEFVLTNHARDLKKIDPIVHTSWTRDLDVFMGNAILADNKEYMDVFTELGFKLNPEGKATAVPTLTEFMKNYIKALGARGIKNNKSIQPAYSLLNDKNSQEILLLNPILDSWPVRPNLSVRVPGSTRFNLPSATVHGALKNRRFPLFEGVHDVFHFIAFIKYPEYAEALAKASHKIVGTVGAQFEERIFYAIEALSLGDPNKVEQMTKSFYSLKKLTPETYTYANVKHVFESIPEKELFHRAEKMAADYDQLWVNYGSANLNPFERNTVLERLTVYDAVSSVDGSFPAHNSAVYYKASFFAEINYLKRFLEYREMPEKIRAITKIDPELSGEELLRKLIARQLAKMEYLTYKTATETPVNVWVSETMRPQVDPQGKVATLLSEVFGDAGLSSMLKAEK